MMKTKLIKKYLLLASVVMILSVTGCAKGEKEESEKAEKTEEIKETEKTKETKFSQSEESVITGGLKENESDSGTSAENTDYGEIVRCIKEQGISRQDWKEKLKILAGGVINAQQLDGTGDVAFGKLTPGERSIYQYNVARDALGGEYEGFGCQMDTELGSSGMICKKEQLQSLFVDLFGEPFAEIDESQGSFVSVSDTEELVVMSDGGPWMRIYGCEVREQDNYLLLTAPCFYGDNGHLNEHFRFYTDFLFEKNSDSMFGVTMLYANSYQEDKTVRAVESSSALAPAAGKSYEGGNLIDGSFATAWVEGADGVGTGETVTLHMEGETRINGLLIYNGYQADMDLYEKNGTVTSVKVECSDGTIVEKDLTDVWADEFEIEDQEGTAIGRVVLEEPVYADEIKITITGARAGTQYEDTCISEIQVY